MAINSSQEKRETSALQNLVDTERAFSRSSTEKGTRQSFMDFIADDGVLFRPTAVNGKRWMRDNPVPTSDKRPVLSWQPIFAEVSSAEDMGYTTGPWQFKPDINDATPVAFGSFITVWKKQANGEWKFVVDLGISHAQLKEPVSEWQPPKATTTHSVAAVDVEAAKGELTKRDWEFAGSGPTGGLLKKFLALLSNDVRLFRDGNYPILGRDAVKDFLSKNNSVRTSQPDFADVSRSGDLGYTYGTYELKSSDTTKLVGKENYLRIWKKQSGLWKIVVDVANPLPPESKP
jgi:ketosteroid isomerase-like protein